MANKKVKDKFPGKLLPISALMLAGSLSSGYVTAQTTTQSLDTVKVTEKAEAPEGKDSYRATQTNIGKGTQQLRDIPQSVTVVTEKLIDDRNLDTFKEALKNTAGISFQAAEGAEEDIRLRGFSLAQSGDIFVDGMRDPAFYDRDTFNLDRLELLRGSASMLFGRGSTGGAVNQVNKTPRLIDEHQVDFSLGSHQYQRTVGDFNLQTSDDAALRMNVMYTKADNNGAGSSIDKTGAALAYRLGIGEKNEFQASIYYLENRNGINYGLPWIKPTASSAANTSTILPVDPTSYYGASSDYNYGSANHQTLTHIHRFDQDSELKTQIRNGQYERDQRASAIRSSNLNFTTLNPNTVFTRGTNNKIQDLNTQYVQSDYSKKFNALGYKHELLAGIDFANEEKTVWGAPSGTGIPPIPSKASTTYGTPNDGGGWVDESRRVLKKSNDYTAKGYGIYAQDLIEFIPKWKLLVGLRYDELEGNYKSYTRSQTSESNTASCSGRGCFTYYSSTPLTNYRMKVSEISKRGGIIFQPNSSESYHFSAATSFNTSGDAYSLSSANVNIPPEESLNLELGAKIDSPDKRFTTRYAIFKSTKLHERNTDPLTDAVILSGKRHSAGFEFDITGQLTSKWEIFGSYAWTPIAKIDVASTESAEKQGDRPALTPRHSGAFWTTYKLDSQWRIGSGINFRSSQRPYQAPDIKVPGFGIVDAMAEYRHDKNVTIKANVSNLTNKLYADQLYRHHYVPGPGRIYTLTTSMKF